LPSNNTAVTVATPSGTANDIELAFHRRPASTQRYDLNPLVEGAVLSQVRPIQQAILCSTSSIMVGRVLILGVGPNLEWHNLLDRLQHHLPRFKLCSSH
jgi:hypothetical protein